ncbi:transporter [Kerstersia gyiorum]|nr:transporter [Kerstersia gyiorum]QBR39310.1 transporter [Kerstersia gyiorum]
MEHRIMTERNTSPVHHCLSRAFSQRLAGALLAVPAVCLLAGAAQAAGTPDPGDYVPAPAGATVFAVYAQHLKSDKVYENGHKVEDGLGLRLDIGVARLMHYVDVGGKTMDFEIILPYARQRIRSMDYRESGLGNLQLGTTYWMLEDNEAGRYAAWAAYLTLPTGSHRKDGFAISEDRYALDLEAAYLTPLGGRWSLDLIGQVEAYTHDDATDVHRRPMARAFAHLSYHWSEQTRLAFSVRQSWGSRETLYGEKVLGSKNDTNLMLTWAHQFTDNFQLQLQYADDVHVRNGSPVRALQARTVFVF